jgi:hypothetical protein
LRDTLLIAFGWLLGLLGGPIANTIARRRAVLELAKPIKVELDDLRLHCTLVWYRIRAKYHTITSEDIAEIIQLLETIPDSVAVKHANQLRPMLALEEQQLREVVERVYEEGSGLSLRRLELPFLASQIHRLDIFTPAVQQGLLKVVGDLRRANEMVDESRAYAAQTFDSSLSPTNHAKVMGNLRQSHELFATVAHRVARSIFDLSDIR